MKTVDSLPFISKLKGVWNFDFSKMNRFKGIAAGQAVSDYILHFYGLIPSFELKKFDVYFYRRTDKFDYERDQMSQLVRGEYEQYDSLNSFWDELYPINVEQAVFYKGRFLYSKEFAKLLSTKQLSFSFYSIPEISLMERLYEKMETYTGSLYINWDAECDKLGCLNKEDSYRRKNKKNAPLFSELINRKFNVKYSKRGYVLYPRNKIQFADYLIPFKDKQTDACRKFMLEFWDILYHGCRKVEKHNFELVCKSGLQRLFSRKAYSLLSVQLKESDLRIIKKYLSEHDLTGMVWRDDIQQTIENFHYLKLLEDDYGMPVIGNAEIFILKSRGRKFNAADFHNFLLSPKTFYFRRERRRFKKKENEVSRKSAKEREEAFEKLLDAYLKNANKKRFRIQPLKTEDELIQEGRKMKHCVGGYYPLVKCDLSRIYSLSIKNEGIDSTLELHRNLNEWKVRQNKGMRNCFPDKRLIELGEKLCIFMNEAEELISKKYSK